MATRPIRVGTRDSALALIQARSILSFLRAQGAETELVKIRTHGDAITDRPLSQMGGSGLFVKAIERALIDERIDLAVHSMKDVPSRIEPGLVLAATTERIDPSDVLISRSGGGIQALSPGAHVATGSLRRRSQLLSARPDLRVDDLRGNVPTRLAKFRDSNWEAIVLAAAGLKRLGLFEAEFERIPVEEMLPAVGQGAIAVETREDDDGLIETLSAANHPDSARAIESERAFLATLDGGCQVPLGAYATVSEDAVHLRAFVGTADGIKRLDDEVTGPADDGVALGHELGARMLSSGAAALIRETTP